jgi:hypothetical protein
VGTNVSEEHTDFVFREDTISNIHKDVSVFQKDDIGRYADSV